MVTKKIYRTSRLNRIGEDFTFHGYRDFLIFHMKNGKDSDNHEKVREGRCENTLVLFGNSAKRVRA